MIKLENIKLTLDSSLVFDNLNLEINEGEIVGIIGASGSGKSALLRCITNLISVDEGRIYFNGELLGAKKEKTRRGKIGMIFQEFNLFGHLSVIENVMTGLRDIRRLDKKTAYAEVMELLRFVGLSDKAFLLPKNLSGGQKQRTAIARTLALDPEIILMDEPTSALDPISRGEVVSVIRLLAREKKTVVIVSHELDLLKDVCTRIVYLNHGRVFEEGTPSEIFENPKNRETKVFVKALRVLSLDINSKDFDFIGLNTTITEYAYRIGMPQSLLFKTLSVLEEFFSIIIINNRENNSMQVSLEYNEKAKTVDGTIYSSGDKIDRENPYYYLSWCIIDKRAKSLEISDSDIAEFTNLIKFSL